MLELQQLAFLLTLFPGPKEFQNQPPGSQAIFGGEEAGPKEWPFVVAIDRKDFLCTGTLIAPDIVFTAGHCFVDHPPLENIRVRFGNDFMNPDFSVGILRAEVHPNFCSDSDCQEDLFDFAFVVLEAPIFDIEPAPILHLQQQWDETMFVGADVTLVGYGLDEMNVLGIKRWVNTTINSFSPSGLEFKAGGKGKDTCRGDSGGPAFVTLSDGSPLFVGVTSRGFACGDGGIYGLPYPTLCWIDEQTGVSLQGECSTCDCVDTHPDRHNPKAGCSITSTAFTHKIMAFFSILICLFSTQKIPFIAFLRRFRSSHPLHKKPIDQSS